MKIVISAGDTNREIVGAFRVCGSLEDLRTLRDELNAAIDRHDRPFCYGWVDVIPNRPKSVGGPPLAWEETKGPMTATELQGRAQAGPYGVYPSPNC